MPLQEFYLEAYGHLSESKDDGGHIGNRIGNLRHESVVQRAVKDLQVSFY